MFLFFIFGTLRMLVRPAMKRLFCLKAKNGLGLRSLGLASLLVIGGNEARSEAGRFFLAFHREKKLLHNGSYEHSIECQK